jgi:hypothetical protein
MNADLLKSGVKSIEIQVMNQSRHFPMTDEPEIFLQTVNGFLNNHSNGQVV